MQDFSLGKIAFFAKAVVKLRPQPRCLVPAFDGSVLDGPVNAFHLAIGPWVLDLGQAMIDAVFPAAHVKHVGHVGGYWTIAWWRSCNSGGYVASAYQIEVGSFGGQMD